MPTNTELVQQINQYLSQGQEQQQQGNIEQSLASYQKVLELNPNSIPALSKLAETYSHQKKYALAFPYYLKIVSLLPKKPVFFRDLTKIAEEYATFLLKKNDLTGAKAVYQELLEHKQLHIPANKDKVDKISHALGEIILKLSIRQGEFVSSIAFFQEAIHNYPNKEWSHYYIGNILTKQGKIEAAIDRYEKARVIRPDFSLGLLSLGMLLLRKGCRLRAFQCGREILQNRDNFRDRKLNRLFIQLLSVHPNPQKSQEALQQAVEQIEITNSNQDLKITTYRNIGIILRNQGRYLETINYYQKSLYYQLQRSKPEFVKRYWEQGKLKEPNFIIVGFAKCGTTAFYDYLNQHPQVLPAVHKELFTLSKLVRKTQNFETRNWSSPSPERRSYLAHFAPRPKGKYFVTGEASTGNIIPGVEKIISSWFPNIKIIALIREPVRRTISHYEQRLRNGGQRKSLEEVINSELKELQGMSDPAKTVNERLRNAAEEGWGEHLAMSLYVYTLERWMRLFPQEKFLIVKNADLAQYPAATMNQAFDFLGLPECNSIEYKPRNIGSYPNVDENLLSLLSEFFRPHNQRLEEFLGRKMNWDYEFN